MGIQQLMLGVGAGIKTYMDDVFNTYLYRGDDGANRHVDNGIDINGEGGMVLVNKRAGGAYGGTYVADTARGLGKQLFTAGNDGDVTLNRIKPASGSNTGFNVNNDSDVNSSSNNYASWSYRKAPGFFDVVTWTGNGVQGRDIPHNLNCVPGFIAVKRTDGVEDWTVYHRSVGATKHGELNNNYQFVSDSKWDSTEPTASVFTVGAHERVNYDTWTYVAYLWAGGESTAAAATSVEFDGNNDDLTIPSSTDFDFGSGDFTIECWIKPDVVTAQGVINRSNSGGSSNSAWIVYIDAGNVDFYWVDSGAPTTWSGPVSGTSTLQKGQWSHIAVAREGNKLRLFVNGILEATSTVTFTIPTSTRDVQIGSQNSGMWYEGNISNVRIVKGTAVYTSSFRPPTEPLTNITNTKLLCCQGSSATSATVIPSGSITNAGSTHTTDSPFDDPAGFKFGDSKEGIVKCGSYVGNGSATAAPEINLGWEPQWILTKSSNAYNWQIYDSMRGIVTGGNDAWIEPNTADAETSQDWLDLTSTGFAIKSSGNAVNKDGDTYTYIAIRRPDGYVGKPVETGTDVFAVDVGNSTNNSYTPSFDSTFYPDFGMLKHKTNVEDWHVSARLMDQKYIKTNSTAAQAGADYVRFDLENGWATGWSSNYIGYMWKRHAGFDVITYKSDGVAGRQLPHSLKRAPEMLWIKDREHSRSWAVYHKGLNGGTNPEDYWLTLDTTDAEASNTNIWHSTAPTATHISLGASHPVNTNLIHDMICLAFSSVDGISKVGSYSGVSNNANLTIDLGFVPRLFIHKRVDSGCNSESRWYIWDSNRGMGSSGTEKPFFLNSNAAEGNAYDYVATVNSGGVKGITLTGGVTSHFLGNNPSTEKYIYYAHA